VFVLEFLELLLGEGLLAPLFFEAATFMAVGGSVHVEEVILLPQALVLIVVVLGIHASWLETAVETVEVGSHDVPTVLGVGQATCSSSDSKLFFL
jgi:hypothetical protein